MSTDRQHDADMDRLLRAALNDVGETGAGPCPDPGDLAAYAEGALTGAERRGIETHTAACARCQQAMAAFARAEPQPEAPAERARRSWLRSGHLRWLIPAVAASGLVLYLAARTAIAPNFPTTGPPALVQAPPPADLRPPGPLPTAEGTLASRDIAGPSQEKERIASQLDRDTGNRSRESAPSAARIPAVPPPLNAPAPPLRSPGAVGEEQGAAGGRAVPMRAARTDLADRRAQPGAAPVPEPSKPAAEVAPAAPAIAAGEAGMMKQAAVGNDARLEAARSLIVTTPGGMVMWRVEPDGVISRSADGGNTWHQQVAPSSHQLLAGSAASSVACWVVGRQGTVLVTIDGERWETRVFPERVDLVAVEARNARTATITAIDGRRFVTTDGGASWNIVR